ncbi:MAG: hypothetical protein AAF799_46895 [Myxococcota bacterium]
MTYSKTSAVICASAALFLLGCPSDDTTDTGGQGSSTGTGVGSGDTSSTPSATTTGTPSGDTTAGTQGGTTTGEDTTAGGGTTGSSSGDDGTTGSSTDSSSSDDGMGSSTDSSSSDDGMGSSSGESSGSSGSTGDPGDPCDGAEVLLYEQTPVVGALEGGPAGIGAGGFIRSADDFEVDAADQCWCVTRVVLPGSYVDAMLTGDLEVGFYEDAPGVPVNPAIAIESGVPTDVAGVFDYTLANPVVLPADTYWLSAMPEIASIDLGIWFWAPGTTMEGSSWAMETTFAPFVPACSNWTGGSTCFPAGSAADLAFEIHGVVGGDSCM